MTFYHTITTDMYCDRVNTVGANDSRNVIRVFLRSIYFMGTEPFKAHLKVYGWIDGDYHRHDDGGLNWTERRFAVKIRQEGKD